MGQFIKISKQGTDVLTATNPNDFLFNSTYNTFKILTEGILTNQTVTSEPTTFSASHGQSGIPTVYAFIKFPDGYVAMPREVPRTGELERYCEVEVDGTNVYFVCYKGATGNYTVSIKYYIFEAPL